MKKMRFISIGLAVLSTVLLSACGATGGAKASEGGEIAVIVKTGNSSFWQNVQTGAIDAQNELKAQTPKLSVTFLGPQSESNINEEINIVESAIDRGVKAIVLAPSDVTALVPAVKKAKDAGIPVVIIDSLLTGDDVELRVLPRHRQQGGGRSVRQGADRRREGHDRQRHRQDRRHVVRRRRRFRDRARGRIQGLHRRRTRNWRSSRPSTPTRTCPPRSTRPRTC